MYLIDQGGKRKRRWCEKHGLHTGSVCPGCGKMASRRKSLEFVREMQRYFAELYGYEYRVKTSI